MKARSGLLATALLGILLAVPLVEIAARLAGLAPEIRLIDVTNDEGTVYRRSDNPILAFELKPGWRDPQADLKRSYPSTNSHGRRDVERTLERPTGVDTRILVLGASVVEGVGIRDLDDTLTRQLEQRLGPRHEVLNFGVSAYCTRAKVELLRVRGLAFHPDVVVLVVTRNDFRNFNYSAFQLGRAEGRPAGVDALYRESHAFRALATRLDWFGYRGDVDPEGRNRDAIGENNVVDGLQLLGELAREHGFEPIVAIWPRFDDDRIVDPAPLSSGDRLVFEALADAEGIASFRFSPGFREELVRSGSPEGPRRRYTVGDRIHPNPFGAGVAAAILADELRAGRHPIGPARAPDPAVVSLAAELGRADAAASAPDARRWVNTGNELLVAGRTDEAIDAFRRAIASDPGLAEAHHNLGVALRGSGRLDEAFLEFLESVRLAPDFADGHLNLGVTLLRMDRPADARRPLARALELRPDDPRIRAALDEAVRRSGGG